MTHWYSTSICAQFTWMNASAVTRNVRPRQRNVVDVVLTRPSSGSSSPASRAPAASPRGGFGRTSSSCPSSPTVRCTVASSVLPSRCDERAQCGQRGRDPRMVDQAVVDGDGTPASRSVEPERGRASPRLPGMTWNSPRNRYRHGSAAPCTRGAGMRDVLPVQRVEHDVALQLHLMRVVDVLQLAAAARRNVGARWRRRDAATPRAPAPPRRSSSRPSCTEPTPRPPRRGCRPRRAWSRPRRRGQGTVRRGPCARGAPGLLPREPVAQQTVHERHVGLAAGRVLDGAHQLTERLLLAGAEIGGRRRVRRRSPRPRAL